MVYFEVERDDDFWDEVTELVEDAYRMVAPHALAALLDAERNELSEDSGTSDTAFTLRSGVNPPRRHPDAVITLILCGAPWPRPFVFRKDLLVGAVEIAPDVGGRIAQ